MERQRPSGNRKQIASEIASSTPRGRLGDPRAGKTQGPLFPYEIRGFADGGGRLRAQAAADVGEHVVEAAPNSAAKKPCYSMEFVERTVHAVRCFRGNCFRICSGWACAAPIPSAIAQLRAAAAAPRSAMSHPLKVLDVAGVEKSCKARVMPHPLRRAG